MSMSRKKCCVPGCMDSGNSSQTLHLFPNPSKNRARFNQWVASIGGDIIGLENEDIYKHRSVCHAHFEEKYCCRYNRLSNIAVPTLNLPGPLSLPKFTFCERRRMREIQNCPTPLSTSASSITPSSSTSSVTPSTSTSSVTPSTSTSSVPQSTSTSSVTPSTSGFSAGPGAMRHILGIHGDPTTATYAGGGAHALRRTTVHRARLRPRCAID